VKGPLEKRNKKAIPPSYGESSLGQPVSSRLGLEDENEYVENYMQQQLAKNQEGGAAEVLPITASVEGEPQTDSGQGEEFEFKPDPDFLKMINQRMLDNNDRFDDLGREGEQF